MYYRIAKSWEDQNIWKKLLFSFSQPRQREEFQNSFYNVTQLCSNFCGELCTLQENPHAVLITRGTNPANSVFKQTFAYIRNAIKDLLNVKYHTI